MVQEPIRDYPASNVEVVTTNSEQGQPHSLDTINANASAVREPIPTNILENVGSVEAPISVQKMSVPAKKKSKKRSHLKRSKRSKHIKKSASNPTSPSGPPFVCLICHRVFALSQAKGGHMSKAHPGKSTDFKRKLAVRIKREPERKALSKAKKLAEKELGKGVKPPRPLINAYKKLALTEEVSASSSTVSTDLS